MTRHAFKYGTNLLTALSSIRSANKKTVPLVFAVSAEVTHLHGMKTTVLIQALASHSQGDSLGRSTRLLSPSLLVPRRTLS